MTIMNARRLATDPIPCVVEGMLPIVGSGIGHGPSGSGKSYAFGTKLALDVCNGVPFFGRNTIQGPVVFCLGEGQQDAGIRIKAQLAQHQQDNNDAAAKILTEQGEEAAAEFLLSLPPYTDDFLIIEDTPFAMPFGRDDKPSVGMQQFIASVASIHPILVIYDALADFASGSIANDYAANQYVKGIKYLVKELDTFVFGIAHDTEKGDKMLGAGRFKNAADIMIAIKPEKGDGEVSTVISEKAKYGTRFQPFSYMAVPKMWDEPVSDEDGNLTGETALVETHVVVLREDAEDDGAFVMPEAAMRAPDLVLPEMRNVEPPKRKRTGIKPAGRPAADDRDKLIADLISADCLECGAPATRGCNPLPDSDYATVGPGVSVHTSRSDAACAAGIVSLDRLLAQCPAVAS